VGKKRQRLDLSVKWKGYTDPTWEKFTEFTLDCPLKVEQFIRELDN
jgi:hypothetical protein